MRIKKYFVILQSKSVTNTLDYSIMEIKTLEQLAVCINAQMSQELQSNVLTDLLQEKQIKCLPMGDVFPMGDVLQVYSNHEICGYIYGFHFENDLMNVDRLIVEWSFVEWDTISKMPTNRVIEIPLSYVLQYCKI